MSVLTKIDRDKSFLNPSYDQLRGLRVTGLATADKCLARWRAEYLTDSAAKESGKWAMIGTAVHVLAEQRLNFIHGGDIDTDSILDAQAVLIKHAPKKEIPKYEEYLKRLERTRDCELIALEREIEIPLGGPKPVYGQIDCLLKIGDSYFLLDHKTNRAVETAQDWARKLQPQLYSFAICKLLGLKSIRFVIGRVNFDDDLYWEYDANHLEAIHARGLAIVNSIHQAATTNVWPEKSNDECRYCPLADTCRSSSAGMQRKYFKTGQFPILRIT